jgi:hypothetical protein
MEKNVRREVRVTAANFDESDHEKCSQPKLQIKLQATSGASAF